MKFEWLINKGFLSSITKWFLKMNKKTSSLPLCPDDYTLRNEKIAAIKQALEAGTYVVDNRALADSMLVDLLWEQLERLRLLSLDLLTVIDNSKG